MLFLIELCIILIISSKKQNNLIRYLSETNSTNITNSINSNYLNDSFQPINSLNFENS